MAIANVQDWVTATASQGSGTSLSVNKAYPSNVTSGNLLIASCHGNSAGGPGTYTVTDTQGNTWTAIGSVKFVGGSNISVQLWRAQAGSTGANTVTFQCDDSVVVVGVLLGIAEFSGHSSQVPEVNSGNTGSSAPPSPGNLVATDADLIVGAFSYFAGNAAPDAGYTEQFDTVFGSSGQEGYLEDQIASGSGTFNPTPSGVTDGFGWAAVGAAWTPSGGGGGGTTLKSRLMLMGVGA